MKLQKILHQLPRHYKRKKGLCAVIACIIFSGSMSTLALAQTYTVGLTVAYNGASIGVIQDESVAEQASKLVEENLLSNEDIRLTVEEQTVVKRSELMDKEQIAAALVDSTDALMLASAIYVDGDFYAAVEEEPADTVTVLDEVLEEKDEEGEVTFTNEVEVVPAICDATVVSDTKTVKQEVDQTLPITTVTTQTGVQSVTYGTEVVENDEMPAGVRMVQQTGEEGSSVVEEKVTTVDGIETAREVTSTIVLKEPVDEIVMEGTGAFTLSEDFTFLTMPLEGCYLSSPYGYRWGSLHAGADLCVRGGTAGKDIVATFDGTVITAGMHNGGYGNYVIIDHGNGYTSLYAHLSSIVAQEGDVVKAGDLLGYAGSTGNSTGAHLHFELAKDGQTMDPIPYLPALAE